MKTLPILVFVIIIASAISTSLCSYHNTEGRINEDMNNALELTLSQMPNDVVNTDTIQCYRNYLTIAELKDTACISMRTIRRGGKQETEIVAEANCGFLTVFKLSDQRASGVLLFLGVLWMIGSLGYMRSHKSKLIVQGQSFGGLVYANNRFMTEKGDYTLNDGSIRTIERNDNETLIKKHSHDIKLTYNLADSTAYMFQASLSESLSKAPDDYSIRDIIESGVHHIAERRENSNSSSPVLDLYLFRQLTPSQSITANAVGTYISTKSSNYYDEGAPYQYDVNGKTASALSEVIYENRLKPFTLSAGINYRYKYTQNDYTGDAYALTELNQNTVYAFSHIKGSLGGFRYSLGLGASYIHYKQNEHDYDFWTFRPKATLAYDLVNGIQLSYTFEKKDRASRIAMISDATIQTNSMEYTVGNPYLKPARDMEHTLRLSYNNNRWYAFAQGFFRHCNKPNMAHYERTADDNCKRRTTTLFQLWF